MYSIRNLWPGSPLESLKRQDNNQYNKNRHNQQVKTTGLWSVAQKTTLTLYWNISPCNIIYKTTVLHYWGKNNCTVCSPTAISCGVKKHFPRPDSHKKLREEGLSETGRHETVGCIQSGLIHRERESERAGPSDSHGDCSHWEHVAVLLQVTYGTFHSISGTAIQSRVLENSFLRRCSHCVG